MITKIGKICANIVKQIEIVEQNNNTSILKITDNYHQILFQNFIDFDNNDIIICDSDIYSHEDGLYNKIISVENNKLEFYSCVHIKKID